VSGALPAVHRYQPHPVSNRFPEIDAGQLAALTTSIIKDGLLDDLVLFEGQILDGRARYEACLRAGVSPRYIEFVGSLDDALAYVIGQ
jgi:ParB-like chromosome segregation protein Spo0J